MAGNVCYVPESGGESQYVEVADPAAGADWLFTVPTGYEYLFSTIWFKFVSGAPAHQHGLAVCYCHNPGALEYYRNDLHDVIQDEEHFFSLALGSSRTADSASDFDLIMGSLPNLRVLSGDQIGSAFQNIDVGDQFSEIRLTATRWKVL